MILLTGQGVPCANSAEAKTAQAASKEPVWHSHPGPWGDFEIRSIYLEAPDSLLRSMPKPNSVARWCFPSASASSLKEFFTKAGLSPDVQSRLLDPQRMVMQDGALVVFPPLSDLEALTPDQRSTIYTELGKSPLNEFHKDPVMIVGGDLDDWLRETHLTDEQQQFIRKRIWHRGRALAFSDVRALLNLAHSDAEVLHIFKTITRVRTLLVNLKVPVNANTKSLIEYWTGEGRSPDIVPILESTIERESVTDIDITHLLPPMMRRRLYTYPTAEPLTRGRMPDCHWTSLNFFNDSPQDYYLDTRLASNHLMESFAPVESPYRFGDMLVVQNGAGSVIHSCVYIADDIVLTKNGENMLTPWVLMWLNDIRDIYVLGPDWRVQGYREKQPKLAM